MQRILVLGAGFAGLWSAVGAARRLDELGIDPGEVEVLVVNRTPWHSIRVRNYEANLEGTRVPLADVLGPIGVKLVVAKVTDIDISGRKVTCEIGGALQALAYDRLVFALGSCLARPAIPGLATQAFDVDTFEGATRLNDHISRLPSRPVEAGQYHVLVVGSGLTGIEVATEMFGKLRAAISQAPTSDPVPSLRVILADRNSSIGADMGEDARSVIAEALQSLGIETRNGISVTSIDTQGVTLDTGERIAAATVVWCAGMRADPLTMRSSAIDLVVCPSMLASRSRACRPNSRLEMSLGCQ